MRIFKNKWFNRFARREGISDKALCEAVKRAKDGLIDADLGGGVIKQRVARPGQGKSGGFRTLIVFRVADRAVFVFGFAKNDMGNISSENLKVLKTLAHTVLEYSDKELQAALDKQEFVEVFCDENL